MVAPFVAGPSYPTLDNTQLGTALGNLPGDYRKAQSDQLTLQQQQQEIERQKFLAEQQKAQQTAFAGGLPMANGQLDTASYMQTLAQKGLLPPDQAAKLAGLQLEQQKYQPAPADQFLGGGGAAPATGAPPPSAGDTLGRLEAGIARVESGGEKDPYRAIGKETGSGDRAYGKYQVMGANIPKWTDEVLGRKMTRQEFLNDPQAQEAVAKAKLGQYLEKYGDAPDAASMWFTGKPLAQGANKRDVNGMTGARYAELATGTKNDATPSIPAVALTAGSSIPRSNGGAQTAGDTGGIGLGARSANGGAQPTLGAGQTVASLAQGLSPNQASNIAKAIGAPNVNAPLNPDQTQKLQRIIAGNYGGGQGQQPAQGGAQPAQAPQQGGQPLVYQPKLDPGFKTQQEEIAAETKKIAELRQTMSQPAQRRADQLEKDRQERIAAITPIDARPGQMKVSPDTGAIVFQGQYPGGNLDPKATENAAEAYVKTGKLPTGIGRGAQGPQEIAQILSRAAAIAEERGIDPDKLAENWQSFGARSGGLKTLFQRATGLTLVENEANRLIPRVRELLPQLDHTQYKDLNAAINAYKERTGDPSIVKLGISAESLSSVYARILKGGGTPTGGETERAHEMLNKAWSSGQINAALDQMGLELQSAKQSTDDTLKEYGLSTKDIAPSNAPPAASAPKPLSTKAEFDALPSGAEFIAPDGSHRRKP